MNVRIAIILIVAALVFPAFARQDEITVAEEVLRYFPAGIYDNIAHQDEAVYSTTLFQNYPDYIKNRINTGEYVIGPLPIHLTGKNIAYTRASLTSLHSFKKQFEIGGDHKKIDMARKQFRDEMREKGYNVRSSWFDHEEFKAGGKVTFFFEALANRTLHVYRYKNLEDYLAEITKYNHFATTEHQINNRPVYHAQGDVGPSGRQDYFIYATSTNELLMATSLDDLRSMVAVGKGEIDTLLNDTRYPGLVSTINDFPNYNWRVSFDIIDRGEYPYQNIKVAEQIPIYVISYLDIGNEIRDVHLYIHPDEKRAKRSKESRYWESDFNNYKWWNWEEDSEFQALSTDNYLVIQKENRVIRTFIHTRKYIEHYIKRSEELNRKARAEWRKKQTEETLKK